jgi:hypothetical protein
VSDISTLLEKTVVPKIRTELRPHLEGLFGGVVRSFLPQTWWFSTESGDGTLVVDQSGAGKVYDGKIGHPDVSITWTDHEFFVALTTGDREGLPAKRTAPKIQVHTPKGKVGYEQLRKRLGL